MVVLILMGLNVMLQRRLAAREMRRETVDELADARSRQPVPTDRHRLTSAARAPQPAERPAVAAVPPFERPERLAETFRALEGSGVLHKVER